MSKKVNQKENLGKAIAVGMGVAAATASAYLLFGPEGKKNRKQIKGWALKMKGEMIEKFEEAKEVTEPVYHKIVDEISEKYAKTKGIDQEDVKGVVEEVKKHWKTLVRDAKKFVKKPAKKAVKKVTKK